MNILIKALSYLYPYRILRSIRINQRKIASAYFSRKFGKCGSNLYIDRGFSPRGLEYAFIGDNLKAQENLILNCIDHDHKVPTDPKLVIGNNAYFGANCHIGCLKNITIGDNLTCGRNVCIIDHSHGDGTLSESDMHPLDRILYSKGDITIGNSVWLCENVVVTGNVKIGDNAIVGANSVVTKDVEAGCLYAGVPARFIRKL